MFRCFLLAAWQICRRSYQAPVPREVFSLMRVSRRIYTSGMPTQFPGQAQAQTPANI